MQYVMNVVAKVVMYVMAVGNVQWQTLAYAINVIWDGNQAVKKFIFDVDGTLTPSRQKISSDFVSLFHDFVRKEKVYLVTGSDRAKTLEQVTPEIYNSCQRVYN